MNFDDFVKTVTGLESSDYQHSLRTPGILGIRYCSPHAWPIISRIPSPVGPEKRVCESQSHEIPSILRMVFDRLTERGAPVMEA